MPEELDKLIKWLCRPRKGPYRREARLFNQRLYERGALACPPEFWTHEEQLEFLDFAKIAHHLRNGH